MTAPASIPAGRLLGRGAHGAPSRCGDPQGVGPRSFGPHKWPRCRAGSGRGGSRSWLGRGPVLPDVRGYTSPCGQGASSSTSVSVTGALLPLWNNACRNGDSLLTPPCWATLTEVLSGSGTPERYPQRMHRPPGGARRGWAAPTEGQKPTWRGVKTVWWCSCAQEPCLGVIGVEGSRVPGWWLRGHSKSRAWGPLAWSERVGEGTEE